MLHFENFVSLHDLPLDLRIFSIRRHKFISLEEKGLRFASNTLKLLARLKLAVE